ncbi:bifunctional kinase-pyrophosphorylase [Lucifera butyrica]|uniref:Putative pyruvate, phosphate dikinase regulatory protein n=1 Tax=Lucifera butyrica TaxID=1351585 RepID=A0A498R2K3_9FIRM|nr:bifunctional kinase-pyrophosphorylase [Lucifera butyrica]
MPKEELLISSNSTKVPVIYVLSDSIGETGEAVVKAAASQFDHGLVDIRRAPYLKTIREVEKALTDASEVGAAIVYTLVHQDLKSFLERTAREYGLIHADIMGPVMNALQSVTHISPKNEPGLIRKLDETYFSKVEAIEFAVKYDDGKEPHGVLRADIVVTGISRTSKTPLCMYLAHKGIKAANVPLVPEVNPPEELFKVARKVVGLTIKPSHLFEIRKERLKTMGLSQTDDYANWERILMELDYAASIMRKIGCPVVDVTNRAVEETAAKVLDFYRKGAKKNE